MWLDLTVSFDDFSELVSRSISASPRCGVLALLQSSVLNQISTKTPQTPNYATWVERGVRVKIRLLQRSEASEINPDRRKPAHIFAG